MGQKHRNSRTTTEPSIEDEIAHLRDLDLKGLRARWQSVLHRPAPDHLSRHLLFAILAYRFQADRFGDLDHETNHLLDRAGSNSSILMQTDSINFIRSDAAGAFQTTCPAFCSTP